jgi:hypothetical protein
VRNDVRPYDEDIGRTFIIDMAPSSVGDAHVVVGVAIAVGSDAEINIVILSIRRRSVCNSGSDRPTNNNNNNKVA